MADGDEVTVHTHGGEFIGRGLTNSQSQLRVRLYSWDLEQPLDTGFWRSRLEDAVALRRDVLGRTDPAGACRLVFSEADGLSGLVVDRYGDWLVMQLTSLALAERRSLFVEQLVDLCRPRGIYLRTERGIGEAEGLRVTDGPLWGELPPDSVMIREHDLSFEVDVCSGQKTGFYLDQRENRMVVAALAKGRRVLDMFCYTGGFALAAARAGAIEVLGVDISESAIDLARRNADRNQLSNVRFEVGHAFDALEQLGNDSSWGGRCGLVILDPPKFARRSSSVVEALRGYVRLNLLATRMLERGGILATCCCSGHVTREDFAATLGAVAERSGRQIQILAQLGQSPDHPCSASCPESNYLKCMIARVL